MGSENWKPTSSSFFPVVSWIYIKDRLRNLQFTVLPDTPEGGTSLHDGQVELMDRLRNLQLTVLPDTPEGGTSLHDGQVELMNLLSNNLLEDVAETTLSAHMLLEEVSRLQWRQAQTAFVTGRDDLDNHSTFRNQDNYVVVLRNGRMRTFLATLAPRI
ncbi:hypothetical protein IscW_ISCW012833 [Ixodes scapularis]|uniref:Uncharacterized protein n=1 Tax=Ixodes scapularis TaxID=6945 RepID=B7QEJ2_IXOSC|nr:hypothetical protein IscW_ISCW012833 [Ixodes scapularis]|eukprot:XP_002413956.1 hypothetical protein IscW_ISCW012833 [Ixodes scapularis]